MLAMGMIVAMAPSPFVTAADGTNECADVGYCKLAGPTTMLSMCANSATMLEESK